MSSRTTHSEEQQFNPKGKARVGKKPIAPSIAIGGRSIGRESMSPKPLVHRPTPRPAIGEHAPKVPTSKGVKSKPVDTKKPKSPPLNKMANLFGDVAVLAMETAIDNKESSQRTEDKSKTSIDRFHKAVKHINTVKYISKDKKPTRKSPENRLHKVVDGAIKPKHRTDHSKYRSTDRSSNRHRSSSAERKKREEQWGRLVDEESSSSSSSSEEEDEEAAWKKFNSTHPSKLSKAWVEKHGY